MSATNIAKNTVTNMAEDLTMIVGYSKVNAYLYEQLGSMFPPQYDEQGREMQNIAREVLSGGVTYLFMSSIMAVIRKEEKLIEYLFAGGEALITVLYMRNKGFFDGMRNKIVGKRGGKATMLSKLLGSQHDQTNSFIGQTYTAMRAIMEGRSASDSIASTISAGNGMQELAIKREQLNLDFAKANNKQFNSALFIKGITGTFTQADKLQLQKIIGRENFQSTPLDLEDLNKLKDVLYIKDSEGNFYGIADSVLSLVNALGFIK